MPQARGEQAGTRIIEQLAAEKRREGFARMALVAVNDSGPFWTRLAFVASDLDLVGHRDVGRHMVRAL